MIDFRTVFLTSAVATSLLAAIFFIVATQDRRRSNFRDMILTQAFMVLGLFVIALRGFVPDMASMGLGSAMLMASAAVLYFTVVRLRGEVPKVRIAWTVVVLHTMLVMLVLALDGPHTLHALTTSGGLAAFMLFDAYAVYTRTTSTDRVVNFVTMGGILTAAFVSLWRIARLLGGGPDLLNLQTGSLEQGLFAMASFCASITVTVGLLMMHWNRSESTLYQQSTRDSLTGILNRRAITARAQRDLLLHERSGLPLSVIMIDLDHFKDVNDHHGHQTGDDVLVQFTALVTQVHRRPDLLARYGGEEFIIVLPQTNALGASLVAARLRRALHARKFHSSGKEIGITVSMGIAEWNPSEPEALDSLIAKADKALYLAKERGRDRIEVFHAAPPAAAHPAA